MAQSQNIALGLLLDAVEELGEDWVDTAGEHDCTQGQISKTD